MRPRLIASDLDGTFLSPDGSISEENRQAVADAVAAGIHVIFATGRPPRWLDVLRDLPLPHTLVISSNGALLWDLADDTAIHTEPISPEVGTSVVELLSEQIPHTSFGVEQGLKFGFDPTYRTFMSAEELQTFPNFFSAPALELVQEPCVKLLVQNDQLNAEDLAAAAEAVIGDQLTITHSAFGGVGLLELSAAGVTKASMLARYCDELGVAADEVAAFGDMPNDRAMLEWAGQPFVMATAHESLASIGATSIGSNADSAVGKTIKGWL